MGKRKGITRREFLGTTAAGIAVYGVGCGSSDAPTAVPPIGAADSGPDVPALEAGQSAVAIVGGTGNVEDAVRRAILLSGGLDEIQEGDTVFIKPNAVHPFVDDKPGVVTSSAVLSALIRIVRERKPGKITVGDRSSRGFTSKMAFEQSGMEEAALAAGADEVYPAPEPAKDPEAWVLLQPAKWDETWKDVGGILAMKRLLDADHVINVPVCKDHRWAMHSLALKNFIGGVGDDSREPMHYIVGDPDRLGRDIAILNQMFAPLLNLIDAWSAVVNGGPEGILGDQVVTSPKLIIAGRDRVAIDAMGVALLKYEQKGVTVADPDKAQEFLKANGPWKMPQIVHAIERGLGVAGPDKVVLRFDGVGPAEALEAIFRS